MARGVLFFVGLGVGDRCMNPFPFPCGAPPPRNLPGTVKLWNFLTGEFIRTLVDINSSYPELNK